MRIVGLDLGSVTLGVSISDYLELIAQGVETIRFATEDYDSALNQLLPILEKNKVSKVVLGLPKHMNGDIGIRGNVSIQFKDMLEEKGYEVILWDERLTTVAAQRILISADVSRKKRKQVIDKMAAVQILQGYLDSKVFRAQSPLIIRR